MSSNLSSNLRVAKDLKELYQSYNTDNPPMLSQAVEEKLDHVVSLVMGPNQTPYHFGFFFFDLVFPNTYPNDPPKVKITTTDSGRIRFNPNLYADGKVCLSILGTWRGETTEIWRSSYSIGYILNAIQSLIMNSVPYHNEPGYETENLTANNQNNQRRDEETVKKEIAAYSDKVLHETLRVAVCDVLEKVLAGRIDHFGNFIKREFLLRYETYISIADKYKANCEGATFQMMPFEYSGNNTEGKFDFATILQRLQKIRQKLDEETNSWRTKGKELTARRAYSASQLKDEHARLNQGVIEGVSGGPTSEDNVFVWNVTIFGPEGTLYEEGMLTAEIVFSEDPNEIPRARFLTNMFHPNISPSGYPCFTMTPDKYDSIEYLLLSLKKLLTNEPNPSPATWVNEEAAAMCFSKDEEERKQWKKRVRTLARRSCE